MAMEQSLNELKGASVLVSTGIGYPEPGMASIQLSFANGTWLEAEYWRLVVVGKAEISSFDHQQKYGLPAPIDAIGRLRATLEERPITNALLDRQTGDLLFQFVGNITLQVFNFTSYEIWHMHFPNGTVEYSNHVQLLGA